MFGSFSHDFEGLPLQRLFRAHTERKLFLLTTPYHTLPWWSSSSFHQSLWDLLGTTSRLFQHFQVLQLTSLSASLSISGLLQFFGSLATSHHTAPGRRGPRWRISHMFPAQERCAQKKKTKTYSMLLPKNDRWKMHKITACNSRCTKRVGTTWKIWSHGMIWDADHNSIVGGSLQLGHKWMLQKVHCWLPAGMLDPDWNRQTQHIIVTSYLSYLVTPLLHVATEVICCKHRQCFASDWHIHQNRLMKKQR